MPPPRTLGVRLVSDDGLPEWLTQVVSRCEGLTVEGLVRHPQPEVPVDGRRSAVLMLMSEGPGGPDLLLTARATTLRSHAGQPAFPGGACDPGEDSVTTALREAQEETGLDPASVVPVALLPDLFLPPSGFVVSPVLGFWHTPGEVAAVDPAETSSVARVPITDLSDPANRVRVRHSSGYLSPGFTVAGMLVWGFTAGLIDGLLTIGGWQQRWNPAHTVDIDSSGLRT